VRGAAAAAAATTARLTSHEHGLRAALAGLQYEFQRGVCVDVRGGDGGRLVQALALAQRLELVLHEVAAVVSCHRGQAVSLVEAALVRTANKKRAKL
jgi:hypothetical protein